MLGIIGIVDALVFYGIPMTVSMKKIALFTLLKVILRF